MNSISLILQRITFSVSRYTQLHCDICSGGKAAQLSFVTAICRLSRTGISLSWYEDCGLHYRTRYCQRIYHDMKYFSTNNALERYYISNFPYLNQQKSSKITLKVTRKAMIKISMKIIFIYMTAPLCLY